VNMPKPILTWAMLAMAWIGFSASASAQEEADPAAPVVERVEITRNQFLQKETFLFYISTKPGDRYDERRVKEDFRRLWDTGFVDDLTLDVRDTPTGGKLVVFAVSERKRIQIVDYRGSKALTTTTIEDELKKKDAQLKIDTFYDLGKARRVETILREMLAEKGRPFATVKHEAKPVGGSGMQVSFIVSDGPKAKVRQIEFVGNTVFSDGKLRGQMKKVKQHGFWNMTWLLGKTTYTPDKWQGPEGDQKRLEDFYLNHGYVTASVGEPKVTYIDEKGGNKPSRGIKLEIPVSEGDQYRVGQVHFEGMTVFKPELVLPIFKLEEGEVYKESKIKKGFDKLRDAYGAQGYFQWTGRPERKPDPARKVVDVTLTMEEDKKYFVGKITFTGNHTTRDKVIRREVYLNEGDVFNTEALKVSIRRINQLGYFKPMEGVPELGPSNVGEDRIDVTFKVEEQNRNQFTFGGGVSGLEGTFVNASFSTANFLGLGETFQVSAQSGRRTKNYQVAVTEPYLFDRPITAGFDIFKRKLVYETFENVVGYTDDRSGVSLTVGTPLGRKGFNRLFANYSFQFINIEGVDAVLNPPTVWVNGSLGFNTGLWSNIVQNTTPVTSTSGQPLFDPFQFGEQGRRKESTISPSFVHNTVDNPWTPRSGKKFTVTPQVAGGPLGGTVSYFKPDAELIWYKPHLRKTALGIRAEAAYIKPYGDTKLLPLYQRFFLGGETQIRGVNIRTVGPVVTDPVTGQARALGGNKFVLFNAEYYVDIGGPLRFLLFFDAGQAYMEGQNIDLSQLRTSTGAELRFIMPVLNVPFRLIYAFNPNRDSFQPKSTFKFAVGTTF
jgi:outer membrane protein insertion porin family